MVEYCERHCLAVDLIQKHKRELEHCLSVHKVELKELLAGLSAVFRHVDKYAGVLQEVERNTGEAHADRGNLQRACVVYRDLHKQCEFVRRQGEVQMEFISSEVLQKEFGKGWEVALGAFYYLGNVTVATTGKEVEWVDRRIAVLAKSILLLEASRATSSNNTYALKKRIDIDGLEVERIDEEMELKLGKGQRQTSVLRALTNDDYQRLIEVLGRCKIKIDSVVSAHSSHSGWNVDMADSSFIKHQGKVDDRAQISTRNFLRLNHELEMILPEGPIRSSVEGTSLPIVEELQPLLPSHQAGSRSRLYSGWALRPVPALRRELPGATGSDAAGSGAAAIKLRKGLSQEEQEDARLLRLVDGYFSPTSQSSTYHSRQHQRGSGGGACNPLAVHPHQHSSSPQDTGVRRERASSYPEEVRLDVSRPQLIVAEEEKLFVEEHGENGEVVTVRERSLVDTVYSLKDQLDTVQRELLKLGGTLEKEQRARRRLEETLRKGNNNTNRSPTRSNLVSPSSNDLLPISPNNE